MLDYQLDLTDIILPILHEIFQLDCFYLDDFGLSGVFYNDFCDKQLKKITFTYVAARAGMLTKHRQRSCRFDHRRQLCGSWDDADALVLNDDDGDDDYVFADVIRKILP